MNASISFADCGFPDVSVTVTEESLVKEAIETAADEWGTDAGFLELSLAGDVLPSASLLIQSGLVADSVLQAALIRWVRRESLIDAFKNRNKRDILLALINKSGHQTLRLDTPTFADENGLLTFDADWIPRNSESEEVVANICFGKPDASVTSVAQSFLQDVMVSSVDLTGLRHVTLLADKFLMGASITKLDLSSLSNVTSIGHSFLRGCGSLISIDLSGLQHVATVGNDFLRDCASLISLEHNFQELRSIGDRFLFSSRYLTMLDLSTCRNVERIGDSFARECLSLESVDLSGLVKLTEIKKAFLCNARSLKELNGMHALSNVTRIGEHFLTGCGSLSSVDLLSFKRLTSVGDYFLNACTSLPSVDFSSFENLTDIGEGFLLLCIRLKTIINISGLKNVKRVGDHFLRDCRSLGPVERVDGNNHLNRLLQA